MTDTRVRSIRSTPPARRLPALVALLGLGLGACSGGGPAGAEDVIDRELFIAAYVDLRATALESDERVLSDEDRAAVLDRQGVTEEQLVAFAEVYGRDVEFMAAVWNEVELRMDGLRPGDER